MSDEQRSTDTTGGEAPTGGDSAVAVRKFLLVYQFKGRPLTLNDPLWGMGTVEVDITGPVTAAALRAAADGLRDRLKYAQVCVINLILLEA